MQDRGDFTHSHSDTRSLLGGSPRAGRWMRPPEPWPEDLLDQAETLAVVREAIERLPGCAAR